jgi:glycosyltransferase involved in cell wall biosynthesis
MDDVCIIVEGIQTGRRLGLPPHVTEIITTLREITFAVVCITQKAVSPDILTTAHPPNLNTLLNICTDNSVVYTAPTPMKKNKGEMWYNICQFYRVPPAEKRRYMEKMIEGLAVDEKRVLNMKDIRDSKELWNLIIEEYQKLDLKIPFLSFYKIFQVTQLPLFNLLNAVIPAAKLYHVFSGLYANWVGMLAKQKYGTSLVIDERDTGSACSYLSHGSVLHLSLEPRSLQVLHELHSATSEMVTRLSRGYADILVTKHAEAQKEAAFDDVEQAPKIVHIQEGIDPSAEGSSGEALLQKTKRFLVGLVARFMARDDIKTYIRACSIIAAEMENVYFAIYAVERADEEYLLECTSLRNNLNLSFKMEITDGKAAQVPPADLDVLVSTSLDDGYADVLMQAMNLGIPLVCVNRGNAAELIHGDGREDSALGESGFLTEIGNPDQIASAVMEILKDKRLRKAMGRAGRKRIETYYHKEANIQKYAKLYEDFV